MKRAWFYLNNESITITSPTNIDWLKLNKNQVGYYRVNYETDMWVQLSNLLVNDINVSNN